MENLQIFFLRNILGFGLQSFAVVLGIYTFNRQKLVIRDYIQTGIIISVTTYFMKLLPITVGVQTMINMIFIYLLCIIFLKMPPYKTIKSTSLCVILILVCEIIVTAITQSIVGPEQFHIIVSNPSQRYIIGVIANLAFAVIIISLHLILGRKGDYYRNISTQDI